MFNKREDLITAVFAVIALAVMIAGVFLVKPGITGGVVAGLNCNPPEIGDWIINGTQTVLCEVGTIDIAGVILVEDNANVTFKNILTSNDLTIKGNAVALIQNSILDDVTFGGNAVIELNNSTMNTTAFQDNSIANFTKPVSHINESFSVFGWPKIYGYVDMPATCGLDGYNGISSWPVGTNLTRFYPIHLENRSIPMRNAKISIFGFFNDEMREWNATTDLNGDVIINLTFGRNSSDYDYFSEYELYIGNKTLAHLTIPSDTPYNINIVPVNITLVNESGDKLEVNATIEFERPFNDCALMLDDANRNLETRFIGNFIDEQATFDGMIISPEDSDWAEGPDGNYLTNYTQVEIWHMDKVQEYNLTIPLHKFRIDKYFTIPENVTDEHNYTTIEHLIKIYPTDIIKGVAKFNFTLTNLKQNNLIINYPYGWFYDKSGWYGSISGSMWGQNLTLLPGQITDLTLSVNLSEIPPGYYTAAGRAGEMMGFLDPGAPDIGVKYLFIEYGNTNWFVFQLIFDTDNDGIPDDQDTDDDNDGINDSDDYLKGNTTNIITNIANLGLEVSGSENLTQQFTGTQIVEFKEAGEILINFSYNFTNATTLDLPSVIIKKQVADATRGELIIAGIELPAGNTKTAYVDKVSNGDTICIRDEKIASLDQVSNDCIGTTELKIKCDSQQYGKYKCTDLGTRFKVEGLTYSGIKEMPGAPVDADGDGFYTPEDCKDNNVSINPGATEICNGVDDNCDNQVDEGFLDTDNDSLADCVDPDDDNDGINDTKDRLIGFVNNIMSNITINITIDNSTNLTKIFNETKKIEIKTENKKLVEFNYNFSEKKLILPEIEIQIQSNTATEGSILVRGINLTQNQTKTVYVDKISGTNKLCIKDAEIGSIANISARCDGTNEILINCPGTADNYTCSITDNQYKISGLLHSGVREEEKEEEAPPEPTPRRGGGGGISCSIKWNCTEWGSCLLNGTQTRFCINTGTCVSLKNKTETQSCNYTASVCIENWECDSWSGCYPKGIQTRSCYDKNNCETRINKPIEEQSCTYTPAIEEKPAPSEKPWYKSLLAFVMGAIIIVMILIVILVWPRKPAIKTTQAITTSPVIEEDVKKTYPGLTDEHMKKLKDYISKAVYSGKTKEQIKQTLLNAGWPEDVIDTFLKNL